MIATRITPPSVTALSVRLARANLGLDQVIADLLNIEITDRDMWLLDPEISHLRMISAQLEQIEFDCDQHGSYKPLGRRLRLVGDAAEMRAAA